MGKQIITISRTYGSGGREIGRLVAQKLQVDFYDKNILSLLVEKTGISEEGLKNADERLIKRSPSPYGFTEETDYGTNHYLYEAQVRLIGELAQKGPCVIVGRLADWILRNREDVLNVFITAPGEARIQRIMGYEDVDEKTARELMIQVDRRRKSYYDYFTHQQWERMENRDLVINSSLLGIEETAGMISEIAKRA